MNRLYHYDIEYSEVFIYNNYLINQIKEGQHVNPQHVDIVREIMFKHFDQKNMVYLSNRVNSYAVDPLVYSEVAKITNLIAMGIVVYSDQQKQGAQFEGTFYTKPFEIFDNLNDAIRWTREILDTQ